MFEKGSRTGSEFWKGSGVLLREVEFPKTEKSCVKKEKTEILKGKIKVPGEFSLLRFADIL